MNELRRYPALGAAGKGASAGDQDYAGVIVPLRLVVKDRIMSFFSTTAVFGTPVDITLSELALESFFPADAATVEALRELADGDR
jgi:hypothetical protein